MNTTRIASTILFALLTTAFTQTLAPRDAAACSSMCVGGSFLPAGGDVPASLPGIVWVPMIGGPTPPKTSDLALFELTQTGENPVAADVEPFGQTTAFLLKPTAPLQPNVDYVVRGKDGCFDQAPPNEAKIHTTDAAPLPTKLGTILNIGGNFTQLEVATAAGSCSTFLEVQTAAVQLMLSEEAVPFAHAFFYTTIVDGNEWHASKNLAQAVPPGESWQGRGKDLLYTDCDLTMPDTADALPSGFHTVLFRASLPGSSVVLESEPVDIFLQCPPMDYADEGDDTVGCSAAPVRSGQTNGFFAAIPALLVALRARRRRLNRPSAPRGGNA